ncbi:MAG: VOC family protein, partial [Bacteroidota bacterium]
RWYEQFLGFSHIQTLGEVGNQRAVLARGPYVFELFAPADILPPKALPANSLVQGFSKIAFGVQDLAGKDSLFQQEKVEIALPLQTSDFDWAQKAMIVKDPEGIWVQFFEVGS